MDEKSEYKNLYEVIGTLDYIEQAKAIKRLFIILNEFNQKTQTNGQLMHYRIKLDYEVKPNKNKGKQ